MSLTRSSLGFALSVIFMPGPLTKSATVPVVTPAYSSARKAGVNVSFSFL